MAGNTRFLPVHIHCFANAYSLPVLFIMIWKVLITFKVFIAYWSYIQYSPPPPSNLNSSFFTWFSHWHFMLYMRVPKFLCSVAFLTVSSCWVLFLHSYVAISCSGALLSTYAFLSIWTMDGIRSHPQHAGGPSLCPPPTLCIFQIPSMNHAIPLSFFLFLSFFLSFLV